MRDSENKNSYFKKNELEFLEMKTIVIEIKNPIVYNWRKTS